MREPLLAGDLNRHGVWERRREERKEHGKVVKMGTRNYDEASSFMIGLVKP